MLVAHGEKRVRVWTEDAWKVGERALRGRVGGERKEETKKEVWGEETYERKQRGGALEEDARGLDLGHP